MKKLGKTLCDLVQCHDLEEKVIEKLEHDLSRKNASIKIMLNDDESIKSEHQTKTSSRVCEANPVRT